MSIMTIRKSIAIGIIALFIGLSFSPLTSASITKTSSSVPIEFGMMRDNGIFEKQTITVTQNQLDNLLRLIGGSRGFRDPDSLLERIMNLLNNNQRTLFSNDLIDILPGDPILSFGTGGELFSRYHGRVQVKKLFSLWTYQNGLTLIWDEGKTALPQAFTQRQIGLMLGFIGVYIYIPPIVDSQPPITMFLGSARVAQCFSF